MTLFPRPRQLAIVGCLLTLAAGARPSVRHALAGHIPAASKRLKPLGALSATNQLRLALGLPLRDPAGLTAFLHDLYAPSSQQFHKFLKPSEFTQRFGPTEEDYAAVSAFAQAHGLLVVDTHANRLLLDVEGSVAEIQKAFGVRLNLFQHPKESRNFYAPDAEPTVEAGSAIAARQRPRQFRSSQAKRGSPFREESGQFQHRFRPQRLVLGARFPSGLCARRHFGRRWPIRRLGRVRHILYQ